MEIHILKSIVNIYGCASVYDIYSLNYSISEIKRHIVLMFPNVGFKPNVWEALSDMPFI